MVAVYFWALGSLLAVFTNAANANPAFTPPTKAGPLSCPGAPQASHVILAASGFRAAPVLGGLTTPRGITLDSRGNLLVVQRGKGITAHTLDANGCVTSTKTLVSDATLNHGIDVLGNKLFASSPTSAFSWDYNAATRTVTNRRTLITGITNSGNDTHTLWASRKFANTLVVSAGSNSDSVDIAAFSPTSEQAVVKVFNVGNVPPSGVDFSSGKVLGFGLRNDVGVTEDRAGVIHSVENSIQDAVAMVNGRAKDVHENNPADLLWKLGSPNTPSGSFHGYPFCFKIWEPRDFLPQVFRVGDWFSEGENTTFTTQTCNADVPQNPLTLFTPHSSPLDIKFGVASDTAAYVSLHGSVDRNPPSGYKVVAVPGRFSLAGAWSPNAPLSSRTASVDIIKNANETVCPSGCFRPVGLAWSANGQNLYVSSDSTGEIFLVKKN